MRSPAKCLLFGLTAATLAASLPLSPAAAATTTTTFTVFVSVVASCGVTANNLNFGTYSGALLDGTTTVTATCTNGQTYTLGLNAGTATGATVTTRKMAGPGTDLLAYGLFQDSGHSTNWGNTPGTDTVASTGTGVAQNFTVFGQVPGSQFVVTGTYSDTITVTLTF